MKTDDRLNEIFERQKCIENILYKDTNEKSQNLIYKFATAAIVEIGEMLQTDTRWKKDITGSHKPAVYDKTEFCEEFADVFLYLLNVMIFADIDINELLTHMFIKQEINKKRFNLDEE